MEANELQGQLKLKQTELNNTSDIIKRQKLANDIEIIKLKLSIERVKKQIKNRQNR
jgi:hypothetical protein